jgi:hypothetical protein
MLLAGEYPQRPLEAGIQTKVKSDAYRRLREASSR